MSASAKASEVSSSSVSRWRAALFALGLAALLTQIGGQAADAPPDALSYRGGYLLTGDYVVGDVDLNKNAGGFLSGTIPMGGVPKNADIVAAFLYWETISTNNGAHAQSSGTWHDVDIDPVGMGVQFRGEPVQIGTAMSHALSSSDGTNQCRSEEHTSELQSHSFISYAVFCL